MCVRCVAAAEAVWHSRCQGGTGPGVQEGEAVGRACIHVEAGSTPQLTRCPAEFRASCVVLGAAAKERTLQDQEARQPALFWFSVLCWTG